jgi:glycosyltransferase involved in cell wall biosynthesis
VNKLDKRLHIAFLINDITALGGTERMCTMISNELFAAGFDVTIISHHESKTTPFFFLNESVKREQLFDASKSSLHHLTLPFAISRMISQLKPDLIISCDTQMCLYSSIPLLRKNHVAWEHFNSGISTRFGSRWFGRRLASLLCKKIIVLTATDKRHWINTLQTNPDKVVVIPNPLPIERPKNWNHSERKNIVLAVGRMTAQKGFDLLIRAWAQIERESKKNWTLRIVGPTGSAKPELEKLIREYQLEQSVELVAESTHIENEYQQAAMYVLSSRYEGFGLTLIEAMGQGLPVIAFNCPMGPSEIIADKYGKLLPEHNIEQLAECINSFLLSPQLRDEYGKLAYTRSEEYTPINIINKWTSMIHQL